MKKVSGNVSEGGSIEILGQQYRIKGQVNQVYLDRLDFVRATQQVTPHQGPLLMGGIHMLERRDVESQPSG